MFTQADIAKARTASVVQYMLDANHAIAPGESTTHYTAFLSPFKTERTASFKVKNATNVWQCWASSQNGDVIRLIEILEGKTFVQAVEKALELVGQSAPVIINVPPSETKIRAIEEIKNPALIDYITQKRGVNLDIANHHCRQINYTVNKEGKTKFFFGVGFQNDKKGWAIRNEFFKGFIGEAYPTLIPGSSGNVNKANVFEGYIDFLSLLTRFNTKQLTYDTYILNSCVFKELLPKAVEYNCFTDNDSAGNDVVEHLRTHSHVNDMRSQYGNYKDFNEYHINTPLKQQAA